MMFSGIIPDVSRYTHLEYIPIPDVSRFPNLEYLHPPLCHIRYHNSSAEETNLRPQSTGALSSNHIKLYPLKTGGATDDP